MGVPREPKPVVLFFGLLAGGEEILARVKKRLALDFSPIVHESAVVAFNQTDYYEREMGAGLRRQWVAVEQLAHPAELVDCKLYTNRLEQLFALAGKRTVNIDPGYVSQSKVVLATTKDYAHRIYVGRGIYEEVTLVYRRGGGYEPWPWTYPDYRSAAAREFFLEVRRRLK